jgi:hypothetical protein
MLLLIVVMMMMMMMMVTMGVDEVILQMKVVTNEMMIAMHTRGLID